MKVPLLDLSAQYRQIESGLRAAIDAVLESQRFINGPQVAELEERIARYSDCTHAVGVSSGTDALLVALMSLGIGPGDEVVTTPYTFFATAGCVSRVGARPVFVDIEPQTFQIDPAQIEAALSPRTKAILPVHLFGQMAEMDPILEIAGRHELPVIEDAAQSIGATQRGRKAGSLGSVGCFSFFPSKNLGALGDAGMVVTRDDALAERMRECRSHGSSPKYFHKWIGGNFRLDTLQAAALLVKLDHLEAWHRGRRANAARYDELLADCAEIVTPVVRPHNESIFNQYVVRVPRAAECRRFLAEAGIGCEVYYPLGLHLQQCFAELGYAEGDFPETERASRETLALPIYPELSDDQLVYVAETLLAFAAPEAERRARR